MVHRCAKFGCPTSDGVGGVGGQRKHIDINFYIVLKIKHLHYVTLLLNMFDTSCFGCYVTVYKYSTVNMD